MFDFVNPFDEPASPPTPSEPKLPEPVSQDRAECEKTTRDAIDAIDLEMRETPYTKEQGEDVEFSRKLRFKSKRPSALYYYRYCLWDEGRQRVVTYREASRLAAT